MSLLKYNAEVSSDPLARFSSYLGRVDLMSFSSLYIVMMDSSSSA